jgi:NADPH-dependent curcumin reductase CurA
MSNSQVNRQWCVARPHAGSGLAGMSLSRDHFHAADAPIPETRDGEVLIKSVYFSPDPMNHAWVRGVPGRLEPIPVGQAMRGGVAGRVVTSHHPAFEDGQGVTGFLDWSDFNVSNGTDRLGVPLQPIPEGVALASGLGALGMTGICAYLGLADIGKPVPGDTVVVSGASGAIGTIAGQIARLAGARVIGTARGEHKCAAVAPLGFDGVVDQTADGWSERLAELCPDGIDVFFDNVGGEVLDAALLLMAQYGRIVICGATAHYDGTGRIANHTMLAVRACTMAGFFYFDHMDPLAHRARANCAGAAHRCRARAARRRRRLRRRPRRGARAIHGWQYRPQARARRRRPGRVMHEFIGVAGVLQR